jgi:hypothetical protein
MEIAVAKEEEMEEGEERLEEKMVEEEADCESESPMRDRLRPRRRRSGPALGPRKARLRRIKEAADFTPLNQKMEAAMEKLLKDTLCDRRFDQLESDQAYCAELEKLLVVDKNKFKGKVRVRARPLEVLVFITKHQDQ